LNASWAYSECRLLSRNVVSPNAHVAASAGRAFGRAPP
jgi:hypothetical protein